MREDALKRRLAIVLVGLLFGIGVACNEHALNPFDSTISTAAVETTEQTEVRPVDILFMVDNSNSMCEEQDILTANFAAFIDILVMANADFHLAVVNSDMVDFVDGAGTLRQAPGTYVDNAASCPIVPDTSFCAGKTLPRFLSPGDYGDGAGGIDSARLREDFACMALTGIDGNGVEMGLETVKKALEKDASAPTPFLRDDALLALVFVTDENDCSDGTQGAQAGPVFTKYQQSNLDAECEFARNVEDSCDRTLNSGTFTFNGETKTAFEWCIEGNREAVEAGVASGDITVECPAGGCLNELNKRQAYYDFLVDLKTRENEDGEEIGGASDIIVAAIINRDSGQPSGEPGTSTNFQRFDTQDPKLSGWCGSAGTQGYRYELFVEMFPEGRRVVAPICDLNGDLSAGGTGTPVDFADQLELIAILIGEAINSTCLQNMPYTCTADGPPEGERCASGERCCPTGQTCTQGPYLAGITGDDGSPQTNGEGFRLCSNFGILVETDTGQTDPDSGRPILETLDPTTYSVATDDLTCWQETGSPLRIQFQTPPSSRFVIKYPRSIGARVGN